MSGQDYRQWYAMQANPQSTAYKGAYVEVSKVPEEEIPVHRRKTFRQKYFSGIKRTLRAFLAVAVIVLIVNVSWLGYGMSEYGIIDGFGTIKEGKCTEVKSLNTWLHFLINVLSTLLLAGSNAFMSAFSSPSRDEVDKAHRRRKFLHIGSLSFGNLRKIAKRKGLVVITLFLSSAPFHLLYNSLVFTQLASNEYYYSIVTEDFLTGASFNLTGPWYSSSSTYHPSTDNYTSDPPIPHFSATSPNRDIKYPDNMAYEKAMVEYFNNIQASAPHWERLSNKDCAKSYSNLFQSSRRNVVLVSSAKNDTNSIIRYAETDFTDNSDFDDNWWICSGGTGSGGNQYCAPGDYVSSTGEWSVWEYPIEYCLSEHVEDLCTLQFSSVVMYIVIGFNLLKIALMTWVLWRYNAEHILTSTGDAVASFLRSEDETTKMMCLANKREMRMFWRSQGVAKPYYSRRRFWASAVSRWRITFFLMLMTFVFLVITFFGVWGFAHVKHNGISLSASGLWSVGFGQVNQNAMALTSGEAPNVIVMSVIANIPQLFLSLVYVMYMGIMTTMFLAADWVQFARKPQTLMVSSPRGVQRGTWMFGAPIAWGLALLSFQTLLHWFISQSLFVVQARIYQKDGTLKQRAIPYEQYNDDSKFSSIGYSPVAIILSTVAAGLLVLSAIIFFFRRFPAGSPPIVSTCSAAISASCHPIDKSEDMLYKELKWGVDGGFSNGIGHCSLVLADAWDTGKSGPLSHGYLYAGYEDAET